MEDGCFFKMKSVKLPETLDGKIEVESEQDTRLRWLADNLCFTKPIVKQGE